MRTLPKAEPVSMENILEEARGSKLGVLILTEDFFMQSPNPMCELEAFVASKVKLLPLFLTISVDQFKEKSRRARWEEQWRKWCAMDEGKINKWRHALHIVNIFNGLEYCKMATNHSDFIHKVVKEVTCIIPPAIAFSEEGICGKDRLCKIVKAMYEKCASKRSFNNRTQIASTSASLNLTEDSGYTLDVVGIYGFAGLGKTTLCKCLCDFYFAEFNGKVCYVDLGSLPSAQALPQTHSSSAFSMRMQHILSMLTGYNNGGQYSLHFSQVKSLLRKHFSLMTDPVFLAIDNILPDLDPQMEADFYLRCEFPKGSKIFITSRSEGILENLAHQFSSFSVVIENMPALGHKEARDIFVHEIPMLCNYAISNLTDEVNECVKMCTIHSRKWHTARYHPLMLKSLAALIRWDRTWNRDWKERLTKLRLEGIVNKNDAWKMVFNMLDITYAVLNEEAKTMFLDLTLFYSATRKQHAIYKWIDSVYSHLNKKRMDKIFLQLEDLCFLEKKSQPPLDLLVDFCKYKVSQGRVNPHYVMVEDGACWPDDLPRSARHISISRCGYDRARTLDLRNVEGVEVLHLVDNAGLIEVLLSPTTCAHLRSLIVRVPPCTSLQCTVDEAWFSSAASQGCDQGCPHMSWLELRGNVCFMSLQHFDGFRPWLSRNALSQSLRGLEITMAPVLDLGSIFGDLRNLESCSVSHMPAIQSIDLTNCTNLKKLKLCKLSNLRLIRGLDKSPHLEGLSITGCEEVMALTISADNSMLCSTIQNCRSLEVISFCTLTSAYPGVATYTCNLKQLYLHNLPNLRFVSGLGMSTNLKSLAIIGCKRLQTLSIPADSSTNFAISHCTSLRSISLCPMLSYPEADSSTGHTISDGMLGITCCPTLRNVDGLLQYAGHFSWQLYEKKSGQECLKETFEQLLEFAGIDSPMCTASVSSLELSGYSPRLAGMQKIHLEDAQQVGLLVSALFKAQPKDLKYLRICCKEGGDCGCDKNEPHFGPLSQPLAQLCTGPQFDYCCPQVRDLASLAQWNVLTCLDLSGCTSVEVWPDFATMTSLKRLNLSYTSLKEWPSGVQFLPDLQSLDIRGCRQLSAEELIKVITTELQLAHGHFVCSVYSLASLVDDLKAQRRDSCSVVDALDSQYSEHVDLFQQSSLSAPKHCSTQVLFLLELMYEVWYIEEVKAGSQLTRTDCIKGLPCTHVRTNILLCSETIRTDCITGLPHMVKTNMLRRLLCSDSFLSLPFRGWSESFLSVFRQYGWQLQVLDMLYELEDYQWLERYIMECGLMVLALVGRASIGWYEAPVNDDLKNIITTFIKCFNQQTIYDKLQKIPVPKISILEPWYCATGGPWSQEQAGLLKVRVGEAVCEMARVPSVAAELGEDFMHSFIQGLEARVHRDYYEMHNN